MAEVIDLLSSSPPRAEGLPALTIANNIALTKDVFSFDSDDFNLTSDLDFEVTQSAKRRKLSPSPIASSTYVVAKASNDENIDLSFEEETIQGSSKLATTSHLDMFDVDELESDKDEVFHFSSSAPETMQKSIPQERFVLELSSGDEDMNDSLSRSFSRPPKSPGRPILSERTANLLAGLCTSKGDKSRKLKDKDRAGRSMSVDLTVNKMGRFKQVTKPSAVPKDDILDSSQAGPIKEAATNSKHSDTGKQDKPAVKSSTKAEKEAEKERKRKEKEQKALDKQKLADIAEVNKSKTNKKSSSSEMIVDMPDGLRNLSVGNQVGEYMKELNVEVTFSREEEVNLASDTEVFFGSIIKWRRKVVADYDEDAEVWKPLPQPRVTREKHVMVYLKAEEFVNLAVVGRSSTVTSASEVSESSLKSNLDNHVKSLRTRYPNNTIIYLIEGITAWNRKSQTVKNRAYTAAVRSQVLDEESLTAPTISQARPRKQRKPARPQIDLSSITQDTTERLLLHLQLHHQPLLMHHTTSPATTASQITAFTQHLSTRPYRLAEQNHNLASASFCMTTGQIRTGATPHETYINMLQEINRVTPSMAYGISSAGYRSVRALVEGFGKEGNLMLEDVRKSVNKDGGWSDRRLGPMVSKRLYRVFMGKDPAARDGIA